MAIHPIRTYGDPVLKVRCAEVTDVDAGLVTLVDDMIETMYDAPGVGLAANQVGVQKRLFVFDVGDGPQVVINPVLSHHDGQWTYEEGCLSVPELYWPIARPKQVHLRGVDLAGKELSLDGDELLARVFLHEVDHLDGTLLIERLDPEHRKDALRTLRGRALDLEAH
ncbi:MAG: peptide deformylase [Actinomycetota bacterium]|nr:peptide deformylase [Actinomycetota bacterium]MDQ3679309.1 peptide deformylase [Actinomycetota bacterium]